MWEGRLAWLGDCGGVDVRFCGRWKVGLEWIRLEVDREIETVDRLAVGELVGSNFRWRNCVVRRRVKVFSVF